MIKLLTAASLAMFTAGAANAVVTVTVEAPGVENTTQLLTAPAVATFDASPLGVNAGLTLAAGGTTATLNTLSVIAASVYGGAGGAGHYGAVTTGHSMIISFTGAPETYFGFYASAIDSGSSVTVYNGATVLYAHAMPLVPIAAASFGNPNAPFFGRNATQGYAFFNVNSSTPITSVVFTQAPTFGYFEFDNLTIGSTPDVGTVPEPTSWALMIAGFAMVGFSVRRRTAYKAA